MSNDDLILMSILISKWRKFATLTHAQRNWLEDMQIACLQILIERLSDDDGFLPPF